MPLVMKLIMIPAALLKKLQASFEETFPEIADQLHFTKYIVLGALGGFVLLALI